MHDFPLITTIAAGFTAAWLLGMVTHRLGLSPIVGYLLAGVIIGPYSPGFVGDVHLASQLAEVGVILLMFGVGLHFHLKDLLLVKNVALPGAIGQSLVATLLGILVFESFGFHPKEGAVIGMALSVASTVVLMRVLEDADVLNSAQGHVAVGWLLVEDVFTVIVLVLIPVMQGGAGLAAQHAAEGGLWGSLGLALLKLGVLVAIVMLAGSRVIPWTLVQVARLRSRELFTLTVLVIAIAIAAGSSHFFGASMALGAFLAGMVVGQSPGSHQAAADALPMRDAFAVLFFVSVGMLFDPRFVLQEPMMIVATLGIILLAKPLTALIIVAVLGHSVRTALTVALGLAQIGEFSFILSELARKHGLLPDSGHNVLVACAILTISLNPMLFRSLPAIENWLRGRPRLWRFLNGRAERRADQTNVATADWVGGRLSAGTRLAVVVGFGPVGRSVHRILRESELPTVIIDLNMDTVSELTAQGQRAIFGDASREIILEQAGVREASHVILTLPQTANRVAVVTAVRNLNPKARLLVRAHYLGERENLERAGATAAVFEEAEAAAGLARLVMADAGAHREQVERKVRDLRLHLILEHFTSVHQQPVSRYMIPWMRTRRLWATVDREQALRQIAGQPFSPWLVVDPGTDKAMGYILAKDLLVDASSASDWQRLIRPLRSVQPGDDLGSTLRQMQSEGTTMRMVVEKDVPLGLIALEDILEKVAGPMQAEGPHKTEPSLSRAIARGGVVLELSGRTREQVIAELAEAIQPGVIPDRANLVDLVLKVEAEMTTDLGIGVAVPHARCPQLAAPLVVMGRSTEGVIFSVQSAELVRLVFLLVTPMEHPDVHLALLGQIARISADGNLREQLRRATSAYEIQDVFAKVEHAPGDAAVSP